MALSLPDELVTSLARDRSVRVALRGTSKHFRRHHGWCKDQETKEQHCRAHLQKYNARKRCWSCGVSLFSTPLIVPKDSTLGDRTHAVFNLGALTPNMFMGFLDDDWTLGVYEYKMPRGGAGHSVSTRTINLDTLEDPDGDYGHEDMIDAWAPLRQQPGWVALAARPTTMDCLFHLVNYHTNEIKSVKFQCYPSQRAELNKLQRGNAIFQLRAPDNRVVTMHSDLHVTQAPHCGLLISDVDTGMVQGALISDKRRWRLTRDNTFQLLDGRIASPLGIWDPYTSKVLQWPQWVQEIPLAGDTFAGDTQVFISQCQHSGLVVVATTRWWPKARVCLFDIATTAQPVAQYSFTPARGQYPFTRHRLTRMIPLYRPGLGPELHVAATFESPSPDARQYMYTVNIMRFIPTDNGFEFSMTSKGFPAIVVANEEFTGGYSILQLQDGRVAVARGDTVDIFNVRTYEREASLPALSPHRSHLYLQMIQLETGALVVASEPNNYIVPMGDGDVPADQVVLPATLTLNPES